MFYLAYLHSRVRFSINENNSFAMEILPQPNMNEWNERKKTFIRIGNNVCYIAIHCASTCVYRFVSFIHIPERKEKNKQTNILQLLYNNRRPYDIIIHYLSFTSTGSLFSSTQRYFPSIFCWTHDSVLLSYFILVVQKGEHCAGEIIFMLKAENAFSWRSYCIALCLGFFGDEQYVSVGS